MRGEGGGSGGLREVGVGGEDGVRWRWGWGGRGDEGEGGKGEGGRGGVGRGQRGEGVYMRRRWILRCMK